MVHKHFNPSYIYGQIVTLRDKYITPLTFEKNKLPLQYPMQEAAASGREGL